MDLKERSIGLQMVASAVEVGVESGCAPILLKILEPVLTATPCNVAYEKRLAILAAILVLEIDRLAQDS